MPTKDKIPVPSKTQCFEKAVQNTPEVCGSFRPGLQALGENKSKIKVPDTKKIHGSVDIDTSTQSHYPQENRWDYALCYDGEVFYIEVHPASSSEVNTVIKKLSWLKSWLKDKAPEILKLTTQSAVTPFYWVQTSRFSIPAHTNQYKRAVRNGILPISEWDYSKIIKKQS